MQLLECFNLASSIEVMEDIVRLVACLPMDVWVLLQLTQGGVNRAAQWQRLKLYYDSATYTLPSLEILLAEAFSEAVSASANRWNAIFDGQDPLASSQYQKLDSIEFWMNYFGNWSGALLKSVTTVKTKNAKRNYHLHHISVALPLLVALRVVFAQWTQSPKEAHQRLSLLPWDFVIPSPVRGGQECRSIAQWVMHHMQGKKKLCYPNSETRPMTEVSDYNVLRKIAEAGLFSDDVPDTPSGLPVRISCLPLRALLSFKHGRAVAVPEMALQMKDADCCSYLKQYLKTAAPNDLVERLSRIPQVPAETFPGWPVPAFRSPPQWLSFPEPNKQFFY